MNLTLKVWRQDGPEATGHMDTHALEGVSPDMSFLEMMDMLNDQIIRAGGEPVAFDHGNDGRFKRTTDGSRYRSHCF